MSAQAQNVAALLGANGGAGTLNSALKYKISILNEIKNTVQLYKNDKKETITVRELEAILRGY